MKTRIFRTNNFKQQVKEEWCHVFWGFQTSNNKSSWKT